MHPRAIDRVLRGRPFEDRGVAATSFVHLAGVTLAIRAESGWEPSARVKSARQVQGSSRVSDLDELLAEWEAEDRADRPARDRGNPSAA